VSGTTARHESGAVVCPGDVEGQTTYILDKIAAALAALGGELDDVVRTRIYLKDVACWAEVARCHRRAFGALCRPTLSLPSPRW
jgi:enamine deaminase RidA (YjgF/YER057c/UK114 family)